MESPEGDRQAKGLTERLVLVSDATTEAERLIACLRVRKFKVRDVPLMLLASRVEAQKPKLVICDGLAKDLVAAITKMRQGASGAEVELLLLGGNETVADALRPMVRDLDACSFARPIDVYSVLQRVEEILGEPEDGSITGRRSMASLPRVGASALSSPGRATPPVPRRGRSSVPQTAPKSDSGPASLGGTPQSANVGIPSVVPSEPSSPDSALSSGAVGRMSDELEHLLQDAERRIGPGPVSLQPVSMSGARMTPEQELDAILPADVLAALDEPVDLDDEDETSHPTGRSERPSSMAPRRASASLFGHGTHAEEGSVERTGSTASGDEESAGGRSGPEPGFGGVEGAKIVSSAADEGSMMTPLPGSAHSSDSRWSQAGTGANWASSGLAEAPAVAPGHLASVDSVRTSASSNPEAAGRSVPQEPDGAYDSVAPGTNPELLGLAVGSGSDAGSTTPPHPLRGSKVGGPLWGSLEDSVRSISRVAPFDSTVPRATPETEPAAQVLPSRQISDLRASVEPRSSAETRVTAQSRQTLEPRSRFEPRSPIEPEPAPSERSASLASAATDGRPSVDIPAALAKGDVARALARCVRSRYSGALAVEDDAGIRRIVMREGDFVMVASGIENESLVAFLIQRGDLNSDAARLTRKLPQFGRHAGAALIAHGYLRQDELWPVLRAHAEWLLGRAIGVEQGAASLEVELSARLQAEPAVFGGATGAEVLVEVVRRVVRPEDAIAALGGKKTRIRHGSMIRLLSECALTSGEALLAERATGLPLADLIQQAESQDFASALYALVELSVLEPMPPAVEAQRKSERPPPRDGLDDDAVRGRVALRRALVDEGDYFALLGVAHEATGYELRHAYLSLRREFEPGRLLSASTAELREDVDLILEVLDEAYDVLREPARRDRYRRALEAAPS